MSNADSGFDSQVLSNYEFVARSIIPRFPDSTLKIDENQTGTTFDIYFQERLLVSLSKRGARYFFPSRRKRMIKWDRITTSGLLQVIEYILRDLAQADYEVFSKTNKQILKRPIHISRYMRCPQCRNGGGIKIILRAESLSAENSQIYTPVSRAIELNGAEIKCTGCDWIGVRGELLRKMRRSRKSEDHDQK
jgi:hypothetical protein